MSCHRSGGCSAATQHYAIRYDKDGDSHYDVLSAFQKSIAGSDPNAGVRCLARLLEGGDLPSGLQIIGDCGGGHRSGPSSAITVVKSCVDAALQLGLPEARIPLSEAVIFLATCPKSNSAINAIDAAMCRPPEVRRRRHPSHLERIPLFGAGKMGRGLTYQYPHTFPNHYVRQPSARPAERPAMLREYGPNKIEQAAKKYFGRRPKKMKNNCRRIPSTAVWRFSSRPGCGYNASPGRCRRSYNNGGAAMERPGQGADDDQL